MLFLPLRFLIFLFNGRFHVGTKLMDWIYWHFWDIDSSAIRQKGESQNGCYKKTKQAKFSEKQTFFNPLIRTRTCAYQGVRNVRFSEKLAYFIFLWHRFEIRSFALLPTNFLFTNVFSRWLMWEYVGSKRISLPFLTQQELLELVSFCKTRQNRIPQKRLRNLCYRFCNT